MLLLVTTTTLNNLLSLLYIPITCVTCKVFFLHIYRAQLNIHVFFTFPDDTVVQ